MSYSSERSKYERLGPATGLSNFDRDFILEPRPAVNPDHAVELLVDDIRFTPCLFRFRQSLGQDFDVARDHALNCLELGQVIARKLHQWVFDCIKCVDVLLVVYMRDILRRPIPRLRSRAYETDVYTCYENQPEAELKTVGEKMSAVYQKRSDPFEHHQVVDRNGRREIKRTRYTQKGEAYSLVRDFIRDALDVMVEKYRVRFPEHCTDGSSGDAAN